MTKPVRQKAILDLLDDGPLASQEDLQRALARRGLRVGQPTLSRDIHELGLVKTSDGYARIREEAAADAGLPSVQHLVREFVTDVRVAQNLLVLKTAVGSAQPVAAALDAESWPEAIGSLAGDDTILVVTPDKKAAARLAQRIREMLA
jgi:transcriptional regulator of arginine metabolism